MAFLPSSPWFGVRFCRAVSEPGAWVLFGVQPELFPSVCTRLFLLGASFSASGCQLHSRRVWVAFRCSAALAGQLALLFSTPAGVAPLWVSASGRVLSGAAESAARSARGGRGSLGVRVQCQCCGSSSELPRG